MVVVSAGAVNVAVEGRRPGRMAAVVVMVVRLGRMANAAMPAGVCSAPTSSLRMEWRF